MAKQQLSLEERKRILDEELSRQAQAGWQVSNRTDTTAQLTKTQGPNGCVFVILLLILILPAILYLVFFKGTQSMYIEVDEYGEIKRTAQS